MENSIGLGLMRQEAVYLEVADQSCEMCRWLEEGFQTAAGVPAAEAYATEILLHRRLLHVQQDSPN